MPHLDAAALDQDPEGLALLADVVRPAQAARARLVPSWTGPAPSRGTPLCATLAGMADVARVEAAPADGTPAALRLARRVAARLPEALNSGGLVTR